MKSSQSSKEVAHGHKLLYQFKCTEAFCCCAALPFFCTRQTSVLISSEADEMGCEFFLTPVFAHSSHDISLFLPRVKAPVDWAAPRLCSHSVSNTNRLIMRLQTKHFDTGGGFKLKV